MSPHETTLTKVAQASWENQYIDVDAKLHERCIAGRVIKLLSQYIPFFRSTINSIAQSNLKETAQKLQSLIGSCVIENRTNLTEEKKALFTNAAAKFNELCGRYNVNKEVHDKVSELNVDAIINQYLRPDEQGSAATTPAPTESTPTATPSIVLVVTPADTSTDNAPVNAPTSSNEVTTPDVDIHATDPKNALPSSIDSDDAPASPVQTPTTQEETDTAQQVNLPLSHKNQAQRFLSQQDGNDSAVSSGDESSESGRRSTRRKKTRTPQEAPEETARTSSKKSSQRHLGTTGHRKSHK